MQQLEVNLTIPIPADSVLISKVELAQLKRNELEGTYWNMKDLEAKTKRKREWIQANILYRPLFKKDLESIVFYPKSQGQTWSFQAVKMAEFLDKNFHRIFK